MDKKNLLKLYHETLNLRFERCLSPGIECGNQTIGAHSIQNAKSFDLLKHQGHVIGFKLKSEGVAIPNINFSSIGRNQASTFHGLCKEHDNFLFEKIDKYPFDRYNNEQLFLYAYRSILHELHACLSRSIKFQQMYREKIAHGLISNSTPTKESQLVYEADMISYETLLYKEKYEELMSNKYFDGISHEILNFVTKTPTIACSQLFSLDSIEHEGYALRGILNIFPISEFSTLVIFSFTQEERIKGKDAIYKCLRGQDNDLIKYEVSKFVLEKIANFFINPTFFEQWSTRKRETIHQYYNRTIINDFDFDDPDLLLFE